MSKQAANKAATEAHLYDVSIVRKTPTGAIARVSRKGDASRSYTVWLDTSGLVACQCQFSRHNPGQPCRHARYTLAALEQN
jgi:hypothetical protein